MTFVSATSDTDALTATFVAEFTAPPARVWEVWTDPRKLERWWGPPTWPATFLEHDLVAGGGAHYVMNGPDGASMHGWWRLLTVDEPRTIEFEDGFAHEDGTPDPDQPITRSSVELVEIPTGTRMTTTAHFATTEQMEQLLAMGMVEGMSLAMGQIDDILAAG